MSKLTLLGVAAALSGLLLFAGSLTGSGTPNVEAQEAGIEAAAQATVDA